mgnify:CR=1 FL=1
MKSHNRSRLAALALAAALVGSLFLSSCGKEKSQSPQQAPQEQTAAVNVNYGISNPWDSLMPYYSVSGSNYARIIYDKLYDRLAYVQADGTCQPRAAERWESADDGYSIVFFLNQKAAFHDGTPVTAQHWVDTITLVTNPACQTLGRTTFAGLAGTDETGAAVAGEKLGVEALDEYTLKLTFTSPTLPEEFLVDKNRDIYVLPTHLLQDIPPEELMTDDFWLAPVGSGPCQYVSEVSGSTLVLKSNQNYQLGAPGFDTLTITVMDKANLLTALIAGDLDYYAFGGSVTAEDAPAAEAAGLEVLEGTVPNTFFELMLNNETIASAQVRRAMVARQQELAACDGELNTLRQSAQEKTGQLQSAMSRLKLMEEMQREMEGFNQSVKRAMAFAHQRGMQGVRGVLAQLLTVPQRYETAIDMALGAAQQNIVTEDEDTAKTLIEYLRQNRLGRATFLPMTTVRSKLLNDRERQALRLPGCLGVASDLVQCDPAYRGIVENLLGRTVIATDLNAGIPIMRAGNHSFRLVTLQGDVMHSGGSMTGGSVQSKMTNLLGREREIKELSRSIEKDKAELNRLRETVNDRQQAKDSLKAQVAEAVEKAHQEEIAVARETQRLESARNELREHQGRMDAARQAEEQLREAIAQLDAQLQALQEESTADSYDPEAMQEETRRLQGVLTQAREASAAQRERVMQLTLALSDAQHELDSMERDKDRVSQETEQLRRDLTRREGQITGLKELVRQEQAHIAELDGQIATQEEAQKAQEAEVHAQEESRAQAQAGLRQLMEDIEALHRQNTEDGDKQHRTELTRSRVENELKTLQDRIWNTWEMTYAGAEAERITQGFDAAAAQSRAGELQSRIRAMGSVNVNAVEEYAATKARYDDLAAQREDLQKAEADLRELIGRLLTQMERTFVENFSKMQGYFAETFVRLFGGGHAELRLADPADPLNCGIEVIAQPPGKKLQLLSLLSGGERALTAIAILFAMLKLKPTPFCILDEIEAALDEANIGYFADYLVEYSKGTQFVVVTHRKGTMERCDSLYGVAMEEQGVSKMVSVSLQDYAS